MKGVIIANPHAGRQDGGLQPAVDILRAAGWTVSLHLTEKPGDATRIAAEAVASGSDAVLAAGGDGTINEIVQALAGTETALGYLPHGTVNVWARELHIPLDIQNAARSIADGRIERIDLGRANDRYFLLMASIGFDTEVLRRAQSLERHKPRFGILPYVATGLSTVPLFRGVDVELRYDGLIRRVHALMVVMGNTRLYGGWFQLTPSAVANDGWLDLAIVKGRGSFALVRQSLPLLLSHSIRHSDVELIRVREVMIAADEPLPLQVDGELDGTTPVTCCVEPKALSVIVPRGFASDLIP